MSTNLTTAEGPTKQDDVRVTSFSGGKRGQMIQLHTGYGLEADVVKMDEAQVQEVMRTLQMWLNR